MSSLARVCFSGRPEDPYEWLTRCWANRDGGSRCGNGVSDDPSHIGLCADCRPRVLAGVRRPKPACETVDR